jgi:hypothetical protein
MAAAGLNLRQHRLKSLRHLLTTTRCQPFIPALSSRGEGEEIIDINRLAE